MWNPLRQPEKGQTESADAHSKFLVSKFNQPVARYIFNAPDINHPTKEFTSSA